MHGYHQLNEIEWPQDGANALDADVKSRAVAPQRGSPRSLLTAAATRLAPS